MDFKKCARCGAFFVSGDSVCCNCKPKDKFESAKLQNYLEGNGAISSIEEISLNTGIATKNVIRHLEGQPNFSNLKTGDINNISINL